MTSRCAHLSKQLTVIIIATSATNISKLEICSYRSDLVMLQYYNSNVSVGHNTNTSQLYQSTAG